MIKPSKYSTENPTPEEKKEDAGKANILRLSVTRVPFCCLILDDSRTQIYTHSS